MPIHIGALIKAKAEEKKFSQEALGQLISRSKQNVGDLYKRKSTDTDMLLAISKALDFDFFEVYYSEEPLKSKKEKELSGYKQEIQELKNLLGHKDERIRDLERAAESDRKVIHLLEEERNRYKKADRP